MTQKEKDKMIEEVLDGFDFDKVHDIMKQLNWEWWVKNKYGDCVEEVPSTYQLIKTAKELLQDVINHDDGEWHTESTGGLHAECDGSVLTLCFILEEYSAMK